MREMTDSWIEMRQLPAPVPRPSLFNKSKWTRERGTQSLIGHSAREEFWSPFVTKDIEKPVDLCIAAFQHRFFSGSAFPTSEFLWIPDPDLNFDPNPRCLRDPPMSRWSTLAPDAKLHKMCHGTRMCYATHFAVPFLGTSIIPPEQCSKCLFPWYCLV